MTCRLCNSVNDRELFQVKGHKMVRCASCGYVQVADLPAQADLAHLYQESYFSSNKYRDVVTLNRELFRRFSLMRVYMPTSGACVLEIGCGTGEFISFAADTYNMYGSDISEEAIEIARRRNPKFQGQLWSQKDADYDPPADFFDAVCAWDVIEHLPDPVSVFQRLMGSIRPGGYLFLSTPNVDALTACILGRYWAFMTPPEHLGFFGKSSMSFLVEHHLHAELKYWRTWGKTVNMGFLLYKVNRILPLIPACFLKWFQAPPLSRLALYVPTGDIQYAVIQKK